MKSPIRYLKKLWPRNLLLVFCFGVLLGLLIILGVHAATSEQSALTLEDSARLGDRSSTEFQNGQEFYQAGQFLDAANAWKAAAYDFQLRGDIWNQALMLSYLSLADQQLGQPQQAEVAMSEAITLTSAEAILPSSNSPISPSLIRAQIFNNQGQLQLSQGQPKIALETWKKSEALYRELSDRVGEIGSKLNQARALQVLGFYLRARTTLEQVKASLSSQPDSPLKVVGLLNLGNVLRVIGDLTTSEETLEQSLTIAQKLQSIGDIPVALLSLGNLAEAQEHPPNAAME